MSGEFDEEPIEVSIRNDVAIVTWDGGKRKRCVPLRIFRLEHERVAKALAEYDARKADVVPMRKKRDHATS